MEKTFTITVEIDEEKVNPQNVTGCHFKPFLNALFAKYGITITHFVVRR